MTKRKTTVFVLGALLAGAFFAEEGEAKSLKIFFEDARRSVALSVKQLVAPKQKSESLFTPESPFFDLEGSPKFPSGGLLPPVVAPKSQPSWHFNNNWDDDDRSPSSETSQLSTFAKVTQTTQAKGTAFISGPILLRRLSGEILPKTEEPKPDTPINIMETLEEFGNAIDRFSQGSTIRTTNIAATPTIQEKTPWDNVTIELNAALQAFMEQSSPPQKRPTRRPTAL